MSDENEQLNVTPVVTATLSIIGSGCISFMVLRRQRRKQTTYHRLLLAMSVMDILFSSQALFRTNVIDQKDGHGGHHRQLMHVNVRDPIRNHQLENRNSSTYFTEDFFESPRSGGDVDVNEGELGHEEIGGETTQEGEDDHGEHEGEETHESDDHHRDTANNEGGSTSTEGEDHNEKIHESEDHNGEVDSHEEELGTDNNHEKEEHSDHGEEHGDEEAHAPFNIVACNTVGFLTHFSVGVAAYNAALSLFYFLVICLQMKPERIARRVEPVLHIAIWTYVLSTGIASIFLELFNIDECANMCYIASYPTTCGENGIECLRGENADRYIWWFSFGELFVFFGIIVFCQISIFRHVRKHVHAVTDRKVTIGSNDEAETPTPWWRQVWCHRNQSEQVNAGHHSKTKEVAKQAFLYVMVFFVTWFFVVMTRFADGPVIDLFHEIFVDFLFPFFHEIFVDFLFPLQGFLNFLVYWRPIYNKYRSANKEARWWEVLRAGILSVDMNMWRPSKKTTKECASTMELKVCCDSEPCREVSDASSGSKSTAESPLPTIYC